MKPGPSRSRTGTALRREFISHMDPKSGFDALFELLPGVSFFAKDKQGRIVAANRHFFRRFGFSREGDILGQDDFALFPQRLAEHFREDDGEVMRSGKPKLNIVE